MKECYWQHFLEGNQYCKLPSINCIYQGERVLMSFYLPKVKHKVEGFINFCDLNLEELILNEKQEEQ